ncbi:isoprenylcysteine carboxyl methyltransferase family protein [Pelagibius sp. Alg239-R121]|uniref:isoprenylcysteine carboxyl methyltransferase family protein n=1 Tax=Pelagibius sp. Alg239-R121 TaxID=2993448 RepID=UPI0024A78783|nr:isoprenylcysteine carboxylmethyltransferase family protein [Pelagibius sp. Alg239-R121]
MSVFWIILAAVALARLGELLYARRNTRRLLARGALEAGAGHYPLIVVLHAAWLASLAVFVPAETLPNSLLLLLFVAVQVLRIWVLISLGRFWTTRIITLPDAPLIRKGPYRFLRHPNYLVVILEIALLPLCFGAWHIALLFSVLNGAMLFWRIRVENTALAARRGIIQSRNDAHSADQMAQR